MNDRFGFSRKEKREARQGRQDSVERDIREKNNMEKLTRKDSYNPQIFDQGILWFNEGLSLNDAPENLRNNTNFINGYKKGERLAKIEEMKKDDETNHTRGSR